MKIGTVAFWRIENLYQFHKIGFFCNVNKLLYFRLTWSEAQKACSTYDGADLASVHSFEEGDVVTTLIANLSSIKNENSFNSIGSWIGLKRGNCVIMYLHQI